MKPKLIFIAALVLLGVFWGGSILADCILDPVSYWKLDDTTLANEVLNQIPGTCASSECPTVDANGLVDGAMLFDGVDDGVTIDDEETAIFDREVNQSFSFSVWFRRDAGTLAGNEVLIGRYERGQVHFWVGLNNTSGGASFRLWDSETFGDYSEGAIDGTTNLADGQWHHIVAVRDSQSNQVLLYVDGSSAGTTAPEYTASFIGNSPMTIGWMEDPYNDVDEYHFRGAIDEVAFFDTALSSATVGQIYTAGLANTGLCDDDTNFAPVIVSFEPPTTATVGAEYTYTVTAEDSEGSVLTWSLTDAPDGMVIDPSTGVITWTPAAAGTEDVTVDVADETSFHDQETFSITVTTGGGSGGGDSGGSGSSGCFVAAVNPGVNLSLKHIAGALAILALILPTRLVRRQRI